MRSEAGLRPYHPLSAKTAFKIIRGLLASSKILVPDISLGSSSPARFDEDLQALVVVLDAVGRVPAVGGPELELVPDLLLERDGHGPGFATKLPLSPRS